MTSFLRSRPWILKGLGALVGVAALVAVLLFLAGVFEEKIRPEGTTPPAAARPGPEMELIEVAAIEEPVVERFPGTVQAIRDAIVSTRITAQVLEVSCRPGDRVDEGAPLVRLDARDLAARASQAEEALVAAQAREGDARAALARMETIEASGSGAISERELEAARATVASAAADVQRARSQVEEAEVGVGFAELTAPFDAVVVDRYVEPGDTAMVGVPAVRLYDPSRMRLEAFVRESLAVKLRPGDEVTVELAALGSAVKGRVEEIVPQAEPGSRSLLVKVALDGTERLYPGLFGRLMLTSGQRTTVRIPETAVQSVGQLRYVVLADGSRRMVTLGEVSENGVEVLTGLGPGEAVSHPRQRMDQK